MSIIPLELVYPGEIQVFEKYDEHAHPELVRKDFAFSVLDVEGRRQRAIGWKKFYKQDM